MIRIPYDNPDIECATARMSICENLMDFYAARKIWPAANAMAKALGAATANWARLMDEDELAAEPVADPVAPPSPEDDLPFFF